jgi:hypothetical protein
MEKENAFNLMETRIKESGIWITSMDKEKKLGQMEEVIKETIFMGKKMVMEHTNGMIIVFILDNGNKIVFKVKELIIGQMEPLILVRGKIIKWTVLEHTLGKMVEFMREGILTVKNLDLEFIFGLTAKNFKECG